MNQSEGSHGGSECQWECAGLEENIWGHPYELEQKLNIVLQYLLNHKVSLVTRLERKELTIRDVSWIL